MPQLDSDTFTYSNGNLATVSTSKWTAPSGFTDCVVASNQVTGNGGSNCISIITTWSGSTSDHYSQVTFTGIANEAGVVLRGNATDDCIVVDFVLGDAVYVFEVVDGTFNQIGAALTLNDSLDNGDVLYAEIQGSTITVKQNGVSLGTRTATGTIASGKPGIFCFGTATIDSWVSGDFSGGTPVTIAPGVGSTPQTGKTPLLGFGINMPDQAMSITGKLIELVEIRNTGQILITPT